MISALFAFARTRWLARHLRTRCDVETWQARQVERFLKAKLPSIDYFAGRDTSSLAALPVLDKEALLANFAALNRPRISVSDIRTALDRGDDRVRGYMIGHSTGTSGNRGYFVISEAERFVWLGIILAKTLPDILWKRHRVALALPSFSGLYQSASTGGRVALRFFDLANGVDAWADDLVAFAPDTIVAPPRVLRRLAEKGKLSARHIFSGAEVLDPLDRAVIEGATGHIVREIYMATEGLFGVACAHGTLHLAQDAVKFEWHDAGGGLVMPLITDFTRTTQIMARYRMNDVLELSHIPCACGSPLQAVARIEGRRDDCFDLQDTSGAWRMITPDILRNAVVDADKRIQDFRIIQSGPATLDVHLDHGLPLISDAAVHGSLAQLFAKVGVVPPIITIKRGIEPQHDRKLRRVRREWHPDTDHK